MQIKKEHVNKYMMLIISHSFNQTVMIKEMTNPIIHPLKHANFVNIPFRNKDKIGAQNNDIKL